MNLKSPLGSPNNVALSSKKKVSFKESSSSKSTVQGGRSRIVTTAIDMSPLMTSPHKQVINSPRSNVGKSQIVTSAPASFAADPKQRCGKSETVTTTNNTSPFMTSPHKQIKIAPQPDAGNSEIDTSTHARFATNMNQGSGQSEIVTSKFGTSAPMSLQLEECQPATTAVSSVSAENALSPNRRHSNWGQRKIVTSMSSPMTPPDDIFGPQNNGSFVDDIIDTTNAFASPTLAYNFGDARNIQQIVNRAKILKKFQKFILVVIALSTR